MESKQAELLALLTQQYREYCAIPLDEIQQKRDKKSFINGLMAASRVVGISYEQLNEIVGANAESRCVNLDNKLEIPTYIRHKIVIGS
ncbi:hypothetical protein [Photobacterium aquimaris]|uniref:Transcriptional regulator n=1 Tax=Photobacterium aquimaris TaxID=512643 RepID=A0A1Y6KT73_9GAMM|nr:hypothetical protein [Photobacterium aquimaris]SMY15400.1 hypothetical protein PAQU9191_00623 [Photobacterium aquimaris]